MGRQRAHRLYPSDLTDEEWRVVKPLIPVKTGRGKGRGRPRTLSMRAVLNALFYLDRTGCQWDYLPRTYPSRSRSQPVAAHAQVHDHLALWLLTEHLLYLPV
jgi:transposase